MMTIPDPKLSKAEILVRLNELLQGMPRKRLWSILYQLEEKPSRWRRLHPRKSCFISVDYDTNDYSTRKDIRNVSVGGAYIETGESFSAGQEIVLWFTDPRNENIVVKVPGKIVRRDPGGIGVKFENLSPQQKELIAIFEKME
ncbi:MAG: PilZ domain-containing protein [Thermodesulfobacteriota bacterium]